MQKWLKRRISSELAEPGKPCCCDVHSLGNEDRIMYQHVSTGTTEIAGGASSLQLNGKRHGS
jgi:hypothetical protein